MHLVPRPGSRRGVVRGSDRRRPRADDLDADLLRDHVLRAAEVRVRPDPEDHRRATRPHPRGGRRGRQGARRGARAPRAAPPADRRREGRGGGDPRRRAQGRGRADRAREGGVRSRARAPARGDEASDRRGDEALARPDPLRGRRPHARGDRTRHRQGPRRRGSAPAHRRGDRRARLLRAGEGDEPTWPSRTACTPARSSRPRGRRTAGRRSPATSPRSPARSTRCPSCARSSATRRSSPRARPPCSSSSPPAPTSSSATSSASSRRRAAPASSPEISAELDALVAQAQNRLAVELTTVVRALRRRGASIVQTIEKASGRKVEATRTVDPSLIGGIVLQIGSLPRRRQRARTPRAPPDTELMTKHSGREAAPSGIAPASRSGIRSRTKEKRS